MLEKLNFQCHRVKSMSFHPYRHWVVCGLHTGAIYMLDYRLDNVVDVYMEHEGSVRAVDFHKSQPLFVSGADDFLIKVWNYNLRRCLFTLSGHTDYIRSTFFHAEQPWIVSASDDYTVRLWNWQSRSCMATLPGHNHFVMCAKFLPLSSHIVSCSLDKTIRVWDIASVQEQSNDDFGLAEFLGTADVAVLHEIVAHEKGVNWLDCHPTENYVVSCADDRSVRVWKFGRDSFLSISRASSGHTNNVSSVMFYKNYIISNGEDRSIRVWDNWRTNPRSISQYQQSTNRFWTLAKDEQRNLIGAGHDSGCLILKLQRERPAFAIKDSEVYYTFEGAIRYFNFKTNQINEFKPRVALPSPCTAMCFDGNDSLLVSGNLHFPVTVKIPLPSASSDAQATLKFGSPCPTAPGKFACISNVSLAIYSAENGINCLNTPFNPTQVFPCVPGSILCASSTHVYIYHLGQKVVTSELAVAGVKYAVWDKKFQRVALISKNSITVASKVLKVMTVITESSVRVKSAVFDDTLEILYFSTSYHFKYCSLLTGEVSTISSLRNVIYLIRAVGSNIYYISRSGEIMCRTLENSELLFKQKLHQNAYREVIEILSRGKLKGQALVGYLHKHKHSEVALQFVKDPLTRFYLALECGVIDIAREMAEELDDLTTWMRLAETAIQFGDIQLSQLASTKAQNYRHTAFLSLITGNTSAMGHLLDVSPDEHFKMEYGLYLDDARERIRLLVDAGQLALAYLTAKSYGVDDLVNVISESLEPEVLQRLSSVECFAPTEKKATVPITDNWPMLRVDDTIFSRMLKEPVQSQLGTTMDIDLDAAEGAWDDEDGGNNHATLGECKSENEDDEEGAGGWGEDEDLGIDVTATLSKAKVSGQKRAYVPPAPHESVSRYWTMSHFPAHHVAAGSFESALKILQKQIVLTNALPLRNIMLLLWSSANPARPAWGIPSTSFALTAGGAGKVPAVLNIRGIMQEKLKLGYQLFVGAKFQEALQCFKQVLHFCVFTVASVESDRKTLRELIASASEYAQALALQITLKGQDPSSPTALELALYFTHFNLLRPHLVLALSQAMTKSYKKKNYRTAATVARRMLDQEPPKNKADQASAIIFDAEGKDDEAALEYDALNPFKLCCVSLKPMYKGSVSPIHCPLCRSPAMPQHRNTLCPTCELSSLGAEGLGLWNEI